MSDYMKHRDELTTERYSNLLDRLERRTQNEYRKDLRNAALASGILGGILSGNYYLAGGTLLYAIGFGLAGVIGFAAATLADLLNQRSVDGD